MSDMSAEYRHEYMQFLRAATNRMDALVLRHMKLLPPEQRKVVSDKAVTLLRWAFDQGYNSRVRSGQMVMFGGGSRECTACGRTLGESPKV